MHVEERVNVKSLTGNGKDVDGVHLHEIARGSHVRTMRTLAGSLPRAAASQEPVTLQRPLHGTQADVHSILLQEMMNDLTASPMLLPASENLRDDLIG